ncbi:MAG: hypothetical protein H6969_12090 [Gammaproteobacteria bacterium]|nr:hypothetical protein [Candidatus Competibacteraceae bacterium]MCP5421211.1 hypothetical protein [Gammaproteobacteria bacterium]
MRIKRTQLVVEIPPDLRTQLKVMAAARGISIRELVTPALVRLAKVTHEPENAIESPDP